jgi:endonuclease YncB( thermonuclease family)
MRRPARRAGLYGLVVPALVAAAALWVASVQDGQVIAVNDGDTLVVRLEGRNQRVRLAEIDAPELHQPYGQRAREFLSGLVLGRKVHVQPVTVDTYERLVAHVRTEDGRDLSEELLRAGLAWWYRRYSRNGHYQELERQARAERRGLWAEKDPVPPWLYRRMHPIVR